jgi:hypothetical protein
MLIMPGHLFDCCEELSKCAHPLLLSVKQLLEACTDIAETVMSSVTWCSRSDWTRLVTAHCWTLGSLQEVYSYVSLKTNDTYEGGPSGPRLGEDKGNTVTLALAPLSFCCPPVVSDL